MATAHEIELARRLVAGDANAFDEFVGTFQAKIFGYSLMTCGQREDAEEVAQETLLKVFQNFDQLRDPENVTAWVFRIARNACYMKHRKSVYAPEQELSLDQLMPSFRQGNDGDRLEIADWSALPESLAMDSELSEILRREIRGLPEMYSSVILLRDFEELSTQETAAVLDVTEDVVKTRLHRARLALRQRLDAYLRTAGTVK
jgi:RNA polymerase sigma-70 factor (ECF subfamily)